ncbi:Ribosomal protein L19/L19e [mine drainage metagenome]|uniref:Ribosomal protein L19/L19e n=1 Tax=mine drainage metagenome TaxID=410659 RepID=T1A6U3_9ZZZZ
MTSLVNQRRMAASILKCGENRVWIDPTNAEDLLDAVTRDDVRRAIHVGLIRRRPKLGVSRVRARQRAEEVARGRHRGPGSRKGHPTARLPGKERWIRRIRPQRKLLAELRDQKRITPAIYREYYRKAKGGMFRSRNHLLLNLRLAGALPAES